jgi:hypothetical protein
LLLPKLGSVAQSAATYQTIRNALSSNKAKYHGRNYSIFLQGSYGNNTNIYAESDVDVVMLLNDVYFSDLDRLSEEDKLAFDAAWIPSTYQYNDFKNDVLQVLVDAFGNDVKAGSKAISVQANGGRRKSDVLVACQFRRYWKFKSHSNSLYDEGICFFNSEGVQIANYPKQHSENLTTKHQNTYERLKPMIRVMKNLKCKLVDDGIVDSGIAPSYYIEGLLFNVPNSKFGATFGETFVDTMNWIQNEGIKNEFLCANKQYYLLRSGFHTSWEPDDAEKFIKAAINLWNDW